MLKEKMVEMLKAMEENRDVTFYEYNGVYHVTFEDFEGFDENWDEVMRDFEDEAMVDQFFDWMKANAEKVEGDFYRMYYFDGFAVEVGYASYDI